MPSKYKNTDKTPEKLHGKKEWKASACHGSASSAVSANGYNPSSGTFHAIATDSGTVDHSSKSKNVDDGDDNANSVGASAEYDSVSNNGSCSGESEDQPQVIPKEKHGTAGSGSPSGLVPGLEEKRDKIRWKNEKKHQRQKERRAKDLKDRSTGYLMSRKLEVLAEQLVSMGFSLDQATMALILNESHVERSVSWLLEGGDGQVKEGWKLEGHLKIDISEELARIAELEIMYKYPRTEMERAIISCQGNVEKATEWLRDRYPIVPESAAKLGKVNVQQVESAIARQLDHSSIEGVGAQMQPEEAHCKSNTFDVVIPRRSGVRERIGYQSRVQPQGHFPARNFEVTTRAGSLVKNATRIGTEKLKLSPKSTGQVVNSKSQMPSSLSQAARTIPSCVSPTANLRSSSHIKNITESKQSDPKSLDATTQRSFPLQHPSHASANIHDYVECTVSHPSVAAHSTLPDVKSYNSTLSSVLSTAPDMEELSGVMLKGVNGANFRALENHTSNSALDLKMEESSEELNNIRNMFAFSETAFCSTNLELTSPYSSKLAPLSSDFLAGWAFGAPGGYVDWNMAAMSACDYRTIDWSMQPSPSSLTGTGSWGIYKGFAKTSNLQDESPQVQEFSKDLISSFQNASLCSSFPRNLGNSFDIWGGSKSRGNSKTLGQEINSGLEEWTSPFAGKDLFIL